MKNAAPVLVLFCFLYNFSFAQQAGTLDSSFDFDGKVVTSFSDESRAFAMEIQQDGKILAGGFRKSGLYGDFVLCRYNNDGSLDSSFGNSGIAIVDAAPGEDDKIRDLKIQNDGKIVVTGEAGIYPGFHIIAARFNSNGTLDSGFGNNGVLNLVSMQSSFAYAVAIDSLNRIFIGGSASGPSSRAVILCYDSTGTPDPSFGVNGVMIDSTRPGYINEIIPTGSGLICCVSSVSFVIAKYSYSGSRDSSFGTNGFVEDDFNSNYFAGAQKCALQPDGKIIAAGSADYTHIGNNHDFVVARFTTDGVLDSTFGTNGYVVYAVSARDILWGMQILPDGKILGCGHVEYSSTTTGYDFALLKLNPDGSRDFSFGVNGLVKTDFGSSIDIAFDMAVQNDSAIVLCGQTYPGNQFSFALSRYSGITITGIKENQSKDNSFVIYPVPVVNGRINFNTAIHDAVINIYDASGRVIYRAESFSGITLNVKSGFEKGIYSIQVISEKSTGALLFTVNE